MTRSSKKHRAALAISVTLLSSRGLAWSVPGLSVPASSECAASGCLLDVQSTWLTTPPVNLQGYSSTTLPYFPANAATALRDYVHPDLQQGLESMLSSSALQRAIREKRLAAALVDVTDLDRPRVAMINGDVMIYAASLPKIAILLGTFEMVERGKLELDDALLTSATRMIRNSSNTAATELYYKVGPENLAKILQSQRYQLYDVDNGGGLWVGKPYAKKDTWRRDPLANLSHGATAFQVARFFYLLESGQLVSQGSSEKMKEILGNPAINHKFVKGLNTARPGSRIYRKSGTWRTYHSDAGIIERDGRRYIAVILANDPAGSGWLSRLIVGFDDLIQQSPDILSQQLN